MTKEDFYFRLVLNVLVGVMYVYALYRMARHTELNEPPTKKTFTKVLGCFFIVLGITFSIVAISFLLNISYPSEALKGYDAIVRPSSAYLYWGYPTAPQSLILTTILNSFLLFGIGGYCLAYMKTANSWWKKTGQFVLGFLLSIVMYSATNFHYFDVYEFIAPALFLVLWWSVVLLYRTPKQVKINDIHGDIKKRNTPSILPHITGPKFSTRLKNGNPQGNESCFETETMSVTEKNNKEKTVNTFDEITIVFCKHCGKKIENDSRFCSNCGKKICSSTTGSLKETLKGFCLSIIKILHYLIFEVFHVKVALLITLLWGILYGIIFLFSGQDSGTAIYAAFIFLLYPFYVVYENIIVFLRWLGIGESSLFIRVLFFPNRLYNNIKKYKSGRLFIVILTVLFATICGIGINRYYNEVRPIHKAEKILLAEYEKLSKLEDYALIDRCNMIIVNDGHLDILRTGKSICDNIVKRELMARAKELLDSLEIEALNENYMVQFAFGQYYLLNPIGSSKKIINERDAARGAYWYLRAAINNHAMAQYKIGVCFEIGKGVEKDARQAINWFRKSAKNGNAEAQLKLGDYFRDGYQQKIGEHWEKKSGYSYYNWDTKFGYKKVDDYEVVIKQSLDSAIFYWNESAAHGNKTAKEDRLQRIYPL